MHFKVYNYHIIVIIIIKLEFPKMVKYIQYVNTILNIIKMLIYIIKQKYDNIGDINKDIKNNIENREKLINRLNKNPLIIYTEFKRNSSLLYR